MKKKVIIKISKGRYSHGTKNGAEYTCVGFQAKWYGSGSPCDTPEQIKSSIEHCKKWIRKEGDIPIVKNLITPETLTRFF